MFKLLLDFLRGLFVGEMYEPKVDGPSMSKSIEISSTGYDRQEDENEKREKIVAYLLAQEGDEYKFGVEIPLGEDSDLYDCAELIEHGYHAADVYMPDGSYNQHDFCRPVHEPKPGDLNFIRSKKTGRVSHVVAYADNGNIVHAVGGARSRVVIDDIGWIDSHPRATGWRRHPDFIRDRVDWAHEDL